MIPADVAEAEILGLVAPLHPERDREVVPLSQAMGRILTAPIPSPLDFPHWDNSAMDGYAVRFEDVQRATAAHPVTLTVIEEIPAGKPPQQTVELGQAARILTGSMVPGCCVVGAGRACVDTLPAGAGGSGCTVLNGSTLRVHAPSTQVAANNPVTMLAVRVCALAAIGVIRKLIFVVRVSPEFSGGHRNLRNPTVETM